MGAARQPPHPRRTPCSAAAATWHVHPVLLLLLLLTHHAAAINTRHKARCSTAALPMHLLLLVLRLRGFTRQPTCTVRRPRHWQRLLPALLLQQPCQLRSRQVNRRRHAH
jgi:hypothetical protein